MTAFKARISARHLEIVKTISILRECPEQFFKFKLGDSGGQLNFELTQVMFDHDFPGHYCRKIKSISISIPAIVGPYQNLNATLVQTKNSVLLKADPEAVKFLKDSANPVPSVQTLRQNWVSIKHDAISRGIDDSGMLVLDSEDERYLPFEGTGAVSSWLLSMPPSSNNIDYDGISDVIVTVKLTVLDGGSDFARKVEKLYIQ